MAKRNMSFESVVFCKVDSITGGIKIYKEKTCTNLLVYMSANLFVEKYGKKNLPKNGEVKRCVIDIYE